MRMTAAAFRKRHMGKSSQPKYHNVRTSTGDGEQATRLRLRLRLRLVEPDLLIVDEYDLDDHEPKRRAAVHRVLYDRYDAYRPTVLITNLSTGGLRESLGHRLWSRLNENGQVLEMAWADQRGGGVA